MKKPDVSVHPVGVPRWPKFPLVALVVAASPCDQFFDPFHRASPTTTSVSPKATAIATTAASAFPEKSIAVLPFENLSEEKANAYFADGMQDEILTRLSRIADLKVISRTSTQHYKSAPENLREIARQLGVVHILEGRVQKSGDTVRVNVQLIKAASDSPVWAETFDRKLTDIFSVESEVAKAIADQLRANSAGRKRSLRRNPPTTSRLTMPTCVVWLIH
jgi:TolB-like protein